MTDRLTGRVIQTRAYLRPAGYIQLSEVMKRQRELYNDALEHRRTAYDWHKKRCATCIENARLAEPLKRHKSECAAADAECATCADLELRRQERWTKCTFTLHRKSCALCQSKERFETALKSHRDDCADCKARRCGHRRLVDGCLSCYCETAAPLRESVRTARLCDTWQSASVTKAVQSKELTKTRAEDPRLGAVDRRLSIGTLDRLEFAFDAFFRRVQSGGAPGYPRFKNPHRFRTVQIYSGANNYLKSYDADTGRGAIKIKGLPTLRFRSRRVPVDQQPKDIKITFKPNGKVWVSMSFEFDCESVSVKRDGDPVWRNRPRAPVGIDMGINKRAMLSCGESLPTRDDSERQRKKRRLLRKLDRQRRAALNDGRARQEPRRRRVGSYVYDKDGSRRYFVQWLDADGSPAAPSRSYRETQARLARLEMREEVSSRNALHRWTADIVRRHDFIAVEDLNMQNMTRSAADTTEEPGSRVGRKGRLNHSILERQWGRALTYLDYKAESAGIPFARVDPKNTSQACARCGASLPGGRDKESYVCESCGNMDDAYHNAAHNILALGWEQWQTSEGVAEPLPLGSRDAGACARLNGAVALRLPETPRKETVSLSIRGTPERGRRFQRIR